MTKAMARGDVIARNFVTAVGALQRPLESQIDGLTIFHRGGSHA
jgi:hypothetical protein